MIRSAGRSVFLFCFLFFLILLPGLSAFADLDFTGFADTYHAMQIKEPFNFLNSKTRLRAEIQATGEDAYLFASMNATHNSVLAGQNGIELNEAYLEYAGDFWDIRIGRQIIIWGKADGIQITDIVSPQDYTEFLAQDYDDLRMPVEALKFRLLGSLFDFELVFLPIFKPAVLPTDADNPWATSPDFPGYTITPDPTMVLPDKKISNSEIGGRLSFFLPGVDVALYSMYTWDDMPVMHKTTDGTDLTIESRYHRLFFAGLDFAVPVNDFVFRGEAAFYYGKHFELEEVSEELYEKNTINGLVGIDWYPGGNWNIALQFNDNIILDYEKAIADEAHTMLITLNISKSLFRETISLSNMVYFVINNQDFFDSVSVDYALSDEFHIIAGADIFAGNEGLFAQYKDNTEVWIKAKYNF